VKPEIKAALLSALVFPGSGQMYLKRYLRGVIMMLLVFAGLGLMIWMTVVGALEGMDRIQSAGGAADLNAIAGIAAASSTRHNPYERIILWAIGCCWLFSVIDAYRLGKRKGN
jgi:TM2 domain-containing membrane protein YozV